jgi:hypothetical protein
MPLGVIGNVDQDTTQGGVELFFSKRTQRLETAGTKGQDSLGAAFESGVKLGEK